MTAELKEVKKTSCRCHFCANGSCNVEVHTVDGVVIGAVRDPGWNNSIPEECPRLLNYGRAAVEYHYHPDRLNFPMKRVGERGSGEWERLSWDQALQEVADKLLEIRDKYGAEAVGAGSGTCHYGDYIWSKSKFLNLFGSPNNFGNEQICHGPSTKAYECTVGWTNINRIAGDAAKCFATNSNHAESHPTTWQKVKAFKESGSKIISIDPRFTDTTRLADYYLQLRPGTDGALIMCWMNIIIQEDLYDHQFVDNWCVGFEELKEAVSSWTPEKTAEVCWLKPENIIETCHVFAANKPAFFMGYQSYDGQAPNGFRTLRANALLNALVGAIDKSCPIAGPLPKDKFVDDYYEERNDMLPQSQRVKQIGGDRFRILGDPGWALLGEYQLKRFGSAMYAHTSNQGHPAMIWRQIISEQPYPVKALIFGGNGALTKYPNTQLVRDALLKLELLVVLDFFPNGASALADYVFPMSDWMERPLLETPGATLVGSVSAGLAAVPPLCERRSDYDFWQGLSVKCGFGEYWEDSLVECWDARLAPSGIKFEELATTTKVLANNVEFMKYAKRNPDTGLPFGFATPSGKCELKSGVLDAMGYDSVIKYEEPNFSPYSTPEYAEEYPFILVAGNRTQPFYHSEFRQIPSLRAMHPDPIVEINTQQARTMNPPLRDGDWAWLETHLGRVRMKVRLTTALKPGVAACEHNWWFPEEDGTLPNLYGAFKSNVNMLLDDDPDKCGEEMGNYTCRQAMCKIYRCNNA